MIEISAHMLQYLDLDQPIEFDFKPAGAPEIHVVGTLMQVFIRRAWITVWVDNSADVEPEMPLALHPDHQVTVATGVPA